LFFFFFWFCFWFLFFFFFFYLFFFLFFFEAEDWLLLVFYFLCVCSNVTKFIGLRCLLDIVKKMCKSWTFPEQFILLVKSVLALVRCLLDIWIFSHFIKKRKSSGHPV